MSNYVLLGVDIAPIKHLLRTFLNKLFEFASTEVNFNFRLYENDSGDKFDTITYLECIIFANYINQRLMIHLMYFIINESKVTSIKTSVI